MGPSSSRRGHTERPLLRNQLSAPQPQVPECAVSIHSAAWWPTCHSARSGSFPCWLIPVVVMLPLCRAHWAEQLSQLPTPTHSALPTSSTLTPTPSPTWSARSPLSPCRRDQHTHTLMDRAGQMQALLQQRLPAGLRVGRPLGTPDRASQD